LWSRHSGAYNGVWYRGVGNIPSRTTACRRPPIAYARTSLRLSAAPEAQRSRAKKAWRLWQGESPCRVRASHPPVSSLAFMAESGSRPWRTRWTKRRQSILEAAGGAASPEVLVQLRKGLVRTPRVCTLPKATRAHPDWRGGAGPPESSGRGMQEERRRRTWEAPDVPAVENNSVWSPAPEARQGKPGHRTRLEPTHCGRTRARQVEEYGDRESPPSAAGESYRA
jgi:hypothetical protein